MAAPRTWVLLWAMGMVLALVPEPAAAHGAPANRDFDVRVLQDWTGPAAGTDVGPHVGEYNGMHTGAPFGPAHDILAVDVREAYGRGGEPGLRIRYIFQGGNPSEGGVLNDTLSFTLDGRSFAFFLATPDNEVWTTNFTTLEGPFPVGDGFPLALDGIVPYAAVGAKVGSVLGDVAVVSHYHSASMGGMEMPGDEAPGGFYYNHAAVPAANDDSKQTDYTLRGPARLLDLVVAEGVVSVPARGGRVVNLTVAPNGTQLEQFVNLTITTTAGFTANVTFLTLRVGPERRSVSVSLTAAGTGAPLEGTLEFVAVSDLGSLVTRSVSLYCAQDPTVPRESRPVCGDAPPPPAASDAALEVAPTPTGRAPRLLPGFSSLTVPAAVAAALWFGERRRGP